MNLIKNKTFQVILLCYSEAFISVIPYLILQASSLLLFQLADAHQLSMGGYNSEMLGQLAQILTDIFPIVLLVAITFQLAKRYEVNQAMAITVSITSVITMTAITNGTDSLAAILASESSFLAIMTPLLIIAMFKLATRKEEGYSIINPHLKSSLSNIMPSIISYSITILLFLTIEQLIIQLDLPPFNSILSLSDDYLLAIRTIGSHLFWFFGLHGENVINSIFGNDFLQHFIYDGLSYKQFYDLFVIFGGSGAGISLVLAIFMKAKDAHSRHIARLATPFVIFNISEILVFGLPIVFNRQLLIPFLLVPLTNLIIAFSILSFFPEMFSINTAPAWVTPVFINAYIATDGNLWALALQFVLIALGVLIYIPFLRKYTSIQSLPEQINSLADKLNLTKSLEAGEGLVAHRVQNEIIKSNYQLEEIIQLLNSDNLNVYYQPKVNIEQWTCTEFEALLRLELANGKIIDPYFLENIENSGLAPFIDLWVCRKVSNHLDAWKIKDFTPKISINLHPDTLSNNSIMAEIIVLLGGEKIDFEIIERSLLKGLDAENNVRALRACGFTLSIDDFGVGYSSLSTLIQIPFNYLKIDKSLIDHIETVEGYLICKHINAMSQGVGSVTVAEGVETKEQLDLIKKIGIRYVQGYYFSPAMEFNKVKGFTVKK